MTPIQVIGHRGAMAHRIENTIASFREALDQGATGLEMDIRRAASGELVVFHDADLARLGGVAQHVEEMSLADLRAVVLRQPGLEGQTARVPTLREVVTDPGIRPRIERGLMLCLEIKSPDIEEALISSIRGWGLEPHAILYAFDVEVLLRVKALAPEMPTNLLFCGEREENLRAALANGISMINPEHYDASPQFVHEARAAGLAVGIGCTNDYKELLRLLDLDVWGIHTDSPKLLVQAKRARGLC